MSDFHFSNDEVALALRALNALRGLGVPEYLDAQLAALQRRIAGRFPRLSPGEVKNICLGLEELLRLNPLDWKAETLLRRFRALLQDHSSP